MFLAHEDDLGFRGFIYDLSHNRIISVITLAAAQFNAFFGKNELMNVI